jgi:hypothetical protein
MTQISTSVSAQRAISDLWKSGKSAELGAMLPEICRETEWRRWRGKPVTRIPEATNSPAKVTTTAIWKARRKKYFLVT